MRILKLLTAWKLSGAEVKLDHALAYLKKNNALDFDTLYILRNLILELRQDWNDEVHEAIGR